MQNIISGWQTMTVFKDVRKLAAAAATGGDQHRQGQAAVRRPARSRRRAARSSRRYLIPPQTITKSNYKLLFTIGFLKKSDVCNGTYKQYCK